MAGFLFHGYSFAAPKDPDMVYVHTPPDGHYRYLPLDLSSKTNMKFRVKACHDACVVLSTIKGDTAHQTYEIVFGADENTRTQLRINEGGEEVRDVPTAQVLNCNEFRSFWMTWGERNSLRVGSGNRLFEQEIMTLLTDKYNFRINHVGIATKEDISGDWFFSGIQECESEFMMSGIHSVQSDRITASSSINGSFARFSRLYTRTGPYKIKSKNFPNSSMFVEDDDQAHLQLKAGDGTAFYFRMPGLTENPGTVSFEMSRKPGWYLRHLNSHMYIENSVSPRNHHLFNVDATFYSRFEKWYPSYTAFESVNLRKRYMRHRNYEVELDEEEDTKLFRDDASFRFTYAAYTGPGTLPLTYFYIGIEVRKEEGLKFAVKACRDAHLALSQNSGISATMSYEIVIGGWGNMKSALRTGQYPNGQTRIVVDTPEILNCEDLRNFWIKWDGGRVRAGKGLEYDKETFLQWQNPQPKPHTINDIGIATEAVPGTWRFYTKASPPKFSWSPAISDKNQYIQADFGIPIVLNGIMTQGSPKVPNWVSKYKVQYRYSDNSPWKWMEDGKEYSGNSDADTIQRNTFTSSVRARYVRLFPSEWQNNIDLRWEVLGCRSEECPPSFLTTGDRPLPDSSFSASSSIPYNEPREARLFTGRGWVPNALDDEQYLEINLGDIMRVQGIITQGRKSVPEWVENFYVYYNSRNEKMFIPYTEPFGFIKNFEGNSDHETPVWSRFQAPFFTDRVRVYPLDFEGRKAMRVEVIGCAAARSSAPSSSGLSVGQKFGIAFGVILLVVIVAGLVFIAVSVRRGQNPMERVKELGSLLPNPSKLMKRKSDSSSGATADFDNPNYFGKSNVESNIQVPTINTELNPPDTTA